MTLALQVYTNSPSTSYHFLAFVEATSTLLSQTCIFLSYYQTAYPLSPLPKHYYFMVMPPLLALKLPSRLLSLAHVSASMDKGEGDASVLDAPQVAFYTSLCYAVLLFSSCILLPSIFTYPSWKSNYYARRVTMFPRRATVFVLYILLSCVLAAVINTDVLTDNFGLFFTSFTAVSGGATFTAFVLDSKLQREHNVKIEEEISYLSLLTWMTSGIIYTSGPMLLAALTFFPNVSELLIALSWKLGLYLIYYLQNALIRRGFARKDAVLLIPLYTFFIHLLQDLYFDITFVDADVSSGEFWIVLMLDNLSSLVKYSTRVQKRILNRIPGKVRLVVVNCIQFLSGDMVGHSDDMREMITLKKRTSVGGDAVRSSSGGVAAAAAAVADGTSQVTAGKIEEGRGSFDSNAPLIARVVSKDIALFSELMSVVVVFVILFWERVYCAFKTEKCTHCLTVGIPPGSRLTIVLLYSIMLFCKIVTCYVATKYDARVQTKEERAVLESVEFKKAVGDLWKKHENYLCAVLALSLVFLLNAASTHRHTFVEEGIFFKENN
jgi:hypothetical protein